MECKNCRSCGAAIVFVRTPSGKKMPCDVGCVYYAADAAGRETFVLDNGAVCKGRAVARPEEATGRAFRPHWTNCPGADKHRRQRERVSAEDAGQMSLF